MKKINNKAIIAALAISVSTANAAPEKLFSVRDVTTNTQLLAHGGLPGSCPGHPKELAKLEAEAEAKKKKKKQAKTSAVKARVDTDSNVSDDLDDSGDEDSE